MSCFLYVVGFGVSLKGLALYFWTGEKGVTSDGDVRKRVLCLGALCLRFSKKKYRYQRVDTMPRLIEEIKYTKTGIIRFLTHTVCLLLKQKTKYEKLTREVYMSHDSYILVMSIRYIW